MINFLPLSDTTISFRSFFHSSYLGHSITYSCYANSHPCGSDIDVDPENSPRNDDQDCRWNYDLVYVDRVQSVKLERG